MQLQWIASFACIRVSNISFGPYGQIHPIAQSAQLPYLYVML